MQLCCAPQAVGGSTEVESGRAFLRIRLADEQCQVQCLGRFVEMRISPRFRCTLRRRAEGLHGSSNRMLGVGPSKGSISVLRTNRVC